MTNPELSNPRAYWHWSHAYNVDEARNLLADAARSLAWDYEALEVVEDVDIRDLDQGHVVPNMGPVNFRGVWYPNLISLINRR
jgi:hypothetical protein